MVVLNEMSGYDPACVKTHTSAKCRKYNSPTRYRTSRAEHHSTPRCAISSRCFYVRGGRWSFRTAKTLSGHERGSPHPGASCGRRVGFQDAADDDTIGEHVEVVLIPLARGPTRRSPFEKQNSHLSRSPYIETNWHFIELFCRHAKEWP